MRAVQTAPEIRRRVHDAKSVVVRTAPGGADRHSHCAIMKNDNSGFTSPGLNGHTHVLYGCDVLVADGHTHDLSARRCQREHDRRVRHVD